MNDEDIKKALEEFQNRILKTNLSYHIFESEMMAVVNALDLINRQQSVIDDLKRDTVPKLQDSLNRANKYGRATDRENARLKAEIERLKTDLKTTENVIKNSFLKKAGFDIDLLAEFKTEAIKECVNKYTEMLIDEYHLRTDLQIASIKRLEQKVLAKMAGGENA